MGVISSQINPISMRTKNIKKTIPSTEENNVEENLEKPGRRLAGISKICLTG
jgi:hypothetical protein